MPKMQDAMKENAERPRSQTFVTAFARGLQVLEALADGQAATLPEIALRAGVDRAVARRSLLTLIELGYVRTEKKSYQITPRLLRFGFGYLSQIGLDARVGPTLEHLAETIGESCAITILDGPDVVGIAQCPSPKYRMAFSFKPGTRMPAYAMTSGRVLLAAKSDEETTELLRQMDRKAFTERTPTSIKDLLNIIRKIRDDGYATSDEELEPSLLSIAVPIVNRRGQTSAGLAVSSSTTRTSIDAFRDHALPKMLDAARELGKLMA
jgi:IclR family transcriptional regulator, pca regulon regulatory protein